MLTRLCFPSGVIGYKYQASTWVDSRNIFWMFGGYAIGTTQVIGNQLHNKIKNKKNRKLIIQQGCQTICGQLIQQHLNQHGGQEGPLHQENIIVLVALGNQQREYWFLYGIIMKKTWLICMEVEQLSFHRLYILLTYG